MRQRTGGSTILIHIVWGEKLYVDFFEQKKKREIEVAIFCICSSGYRLASGKQLLRGKMAK
jgi:hypothetical protein